MKKNILITGYDGFVAKHLATFLKKKILIFSYPIIKILKKEIKKLPL